MSAPVAGGLLLAVTGVAALAFGLYALLRGGKEHRGGGIGPFSERSVHVIAGIRMTVIGIASLAAGAYLLWVGL